MSSIPTLWVPFAEAFPNPIDLPPDTAKHVGTVLRMQEGERLRLFNGKGSVVEGTLARVDRYTLRLVDPVALDWDHELPIRIRVVQALPKQMDQLETVLQHGTELGVDAFDIFRSCRCVARWDPAKAEQRIERWRRIATGASEQSHRTVLPDVQWCAEPRFHSDELAIVLHESAEVAISQVLPEEVPARLSLWIGPEGGFDPAEVMPWSSRGAAVAHLGPRILRTETAALAAVSRIIGHYRL